MTDEDEDLRLEEAQIEASEYRVALADIWAILRPDLGAQWRWSIGMLEDIAEIVERTGVKHNSPPPYYHH